MPFVIISHTLVSTHAYSVTIAMHNNISYIPEYVYFSLVFIITYKHVYSYIQENVIVNHTYTYTY